MEVTKKYRKGNVSKIYSIDEVKVDGLAEGDGYQKTEHINTAK